MIRPYFLRTYVAIASSSSLPAMRTASAETMPLIASTAACVTPPPSCTTMLPDGVATGRPTPMAAASGCWIR